MEGLKSPELSPGGRQVVLGVQLALFALLAEQRAEAVQVCHEGLDGELGVDRGLEVQHGRVGVFRDALEHLPIISLVIFALYVACSVTLI